MAAVLGDIYPAIIPCCLVNLILIGPPFACTDRLLLLLLTRTGDCVLEVEGLSNLCVSQKKKKHFHSLEKSNEYVLIDTVCALPLQLV
jgi:hypothetical protein